MSRSYKEFMAEKQKKMNTKSSKDGGSSHAVPRIFTFQELAQATNNFGDDRLIGKGRFGKLYKGWLKNSNQVCDSSNHQHY